jgi:hypothetical protein
MLRKSGGLLGPTVVEGGDFVKRCESGDDLWDVK